MGVRTRSSAFVARGKVSAIYNNAQIAAESFPDADISVIDSLQLSLAQGFYGTFGCGSCP